MPSNSPKQHRFMQAIAHSPSFAAKAGVATSVGKDFVAADKKAHKFADGGMVKIQAGNEQLRLPGPTVMGGGKGKIITSSPFRPRWGEQARPFADGGSTAPTWQQNVLDNDEAENAAVQDSGRVGGGLAAGMGMGMATNAENDLHWLGGAAEAVGGKNPFPTAQEFTNKLYENPILSKLAYAAPEVSAPAFHYGKYTPIPMPGSWVEAGFKGLAENAPKLLRGARDLADTDVGALFSKLKPAATAAYDTATATPSPLPTTHAVDATFNDFLAARNAQRGGLGSVLQNNGGSPGAEGAGTIESINRLKGQAGENHYMVHRSGSATSMPGTVDRVDQFPGPDHIRVQEHPGGAMQVHSTGSNITQDDIPGILARFKQSQNLPRLFGGQ